MLFSLHDSYYRELIRQNVNYIQATIKLRDIFQVMLTEKYDDELILIEIKIHIYSETEMTNANDISNEALRKVANENVINRKQPSQPDEQKTPATVVEYKPQIRWPDLGAQLFLHTGAVYGLIFLLYKVKLLTFIWCKYSTYDISQWQFPFGTVKKVAAFTLNY